MQLKQDNEWAAKAKNSLKAEFVKRGLGYDDVILLLEKIGVSETYKGFAGKIGRGTFQYLFYLQCMEALEHADNLARGGER